MGAPPAEDGDRDLYIGSSTAWELPPGSQVGMLEVSGRGFGAQMARLQQVEQHMQALGAGMLKDKAGVEAAATAKSEEHTSELQSLMRISYAVFCLKKKKTKYETKCSRQTDKSDKTTIYTPYKII